MRRHNLPSLLRREVGVITALETVVQDLRYGLRMLVRQPLFTATAVLTLALVIGATAAIFTLLDNVFLRPWPFPHPERLVLIVAKNNAGDRMPLSMPDLLDFGASPTLEIMAAAQGESVTLTGLGDPARLAGAFVSYQFFPLFGVRPLLGRIFGPDDDRPGAAAVCLLNEAVWRSRFGADPHLVGRTVILNRQPFTVAGIIPSSFEEPIAPADVWLPVQHFTDYSVDRSRAVAVGMARVADGVSMNQARGRLEALARQLAAVYPDTNRNKSVLVQPMREVLTASARPTLFLLGAAAACILLIACANIAGLLTARAWARRHEIAVRVSLGAGSGRLLRQMLTESLLLGLLGGLIGLALAVSGARVLPAFIGDLPNPTSAASPPFIAAVVAALSLASALVFGLAPALLTRGIASTVRTRSAMHLGLRGAFITGQVALALILLAAAGLTVKSLWRLMHVDPGLNPARILTMEYRRPDNGENHTRFHNEVVRRVSALPGVEAAGIVRALPFSGNAGITVFALPDRPEPPVGMPNMSGYNAAGPTYFSTVGIPVLAGRGFLPSDTPAAARVVIVSRGFAARYWPGKNAIGKQLLIPPEDLAASGTRVRMVPATVVGVVGDVRQQSLDEVVRPQIYVPDAQVPSQFATLVVRARRDPLAIAKDVQRAVWSIDPDQAVWKIRTLESLVQHSARENGRATLVFALASFSVLALLLAAIGLYGIVAFTVRQRTAEFGIRMAVGASPRSLMKLVLVRGLALTGIGLAIGMAASLILNRFLASQLYEVRPTDPAVYAAISAFLVLIATLAILGPARRAMCIDPASALRHD